MCVQFGLKLKAANEADRFVESQQKKNPDFVFYKQKLGCICLSSCLCYYDDHVHF